jgi:hypothetical protein
MNFEIFLFVSYKSMLLKKFGQIFYNIDNLLKFKLTSIKTGFIKNIFILYFENLYCLLNSLKKNTKFLRNFSSLKELIDLNVYESRSWSINNYIKNREMSLFYFKKKENLEYARKYIKLFKGGKKNFCLDCFSLIFKDILYLSLKNNKHSYNILPYIILILNRKKLKKYKIFEKSFRIINKINFFKNLKKYKIFEKLDTFSPINKNLKFFFVIGSKYLIQLTNKNASILKILKFNITSDTSFGFFFDKKFLLYKTTFIIKSSGYIFWKKISSHSFFLCPVEKESSFSKVSILSCGHIFSFETIKKITESFLTMMEHTNLLNKLTFPDFIECPWCEIIQEKLYHLNICLNIIISAPVKKKIFGNNELQERRILKKIDVLDKNENYFNKWIKTNYFYSLRYVLK